MTNWAKLVENASKGEWGIKAVIVVGVWIVAPVAGGLEFEMNLSFFLLILLTVAIPFLNLLFDEFIATRG